MIKDLTNDMIRLSAEISALRHNRAALTCDLTLGRVELGNTVSEMIAGFHHNREEMGEKTKAELDEARANLESTIAEMIAGFQRDREEMGEKTKAELSEAKANLEKTISELITGFQRDREEKGEKTKAELNEFVADLRHKVVGLRAEFANDIKGAHTAWSSSPAERTPTQNGSGKREERGESASFEARESVSNVEDAVAELRQNDGGDHAEFASNVEEDHSAWSHSATEQNPSESSSEKPYEAHVKSKRKKR